jgi:hypothetical protein
MRLPLALLAGRGSASIAPVGGRLLLLLLRRRLLLLLRLRWRRGGAAGGWPVGAAAVMHPAQRDGFRFAQTASLEVAADTIGCGFVEVCRQRHRRQRGAAAAAAA